MKKLITAGLGMVLGMNVALAEVQVGAELPALKLQDQHEKAQELSAKTKTVLFTWDRGGNKVVAQALEKADAAALEASGTAYVADISKMPGVITKFFALPKMKKYPYSVMLDTEGKVTQAWPQKAESVTVLRLKELKVEKIEFFTASEELKKALGF